MPARRRSPQWVREMSSRELHGIAFRFNHDRMTADLTERQEWLWAACVSELEWRRAHTYPYWDRCACELCFVPFPDD